MKPVADALPQDNSNAERARMLDLLLPLTLPACAQVAAASDPLLALLQGADAGDPNPRPAAGAASAFSHQSSLSSEDLRLPGLGSPEAATPILAIAAATVHEARRDPRARAPTDEEPRCGAVPVLRQPQKWQRCGFLLT